MAAIVGAAGSPALAQCDAWLVGPLSPTGSSYSVNAFTRFGSVVVGAGQFSARTTAGGTATNIMAWNGTTVTTFGTGMGVQGQSAVVWALASYSPPTGLGSFLAGGSFSTAGGVSVNNIAAWNVGLGSNGTWSAMGAGLNGPVYTITRFNNEWYAGGLFTASGGTTANRIARFDGTNWQPVGSGFNGPVYALTVYNGNLYAGGAFTAAGSVSTGGFAAWNGTSWSAVGGYFGGTIQAMTVYNSALVIGGAFTGFGGSPNISTYNSVTGYANLGTGGTTGTDGNGGIVYAVAADGDSLYIGGDFQAAGGVSVNNIAHWNGSAWTDVRGGTFSAVHALQPFNGEINTGGGFSGLAGTGTSSDGWARYSEAGAPWIDSQPAPVTITCTGTATFSGVVASGYIAQYSWRRNMLPLSDGVTASGSIISGSSTQTLTILDATSADAGSYDLVVANSCESSTSAEAALTVNTPLPADFNCSGTVTVQDIFDFLSAWFSHNPRADFNNSGAVTVQDIFDFLTAWFAAG